MRCGKKDDGVGNGCINEAGHKGWCKVRPGPQAQGELIRRRGKSAAPRAARASGRSPGSAPAHAPAKRGGFGRAMGELSDLAGKIEAETAALIADSRRALEAVAAVAERVNARNRKLLAALVNSRREVRALADGAEASGDAEHAEKRNSRAR